jgi:hypothetical protein
MNLAKYESPPNQLTNTVEQRTSLEAIGSSASQNIPTLYKPKGSLSC